MTTAFIPQPAPSLLPSPTLPIKHRAMFSSLRRPTLGAPTPPTGVTSSAGVQLAMFQRFLRPLKLSPYT